MTSAGRLTGLVTRHWSLVTAFAMSFKRRLALSIVALSLGLVTLLSLAYLRYLVTMHVQSALEQVQRVAEQVLSATLETVSKRIGERGFDPSALKEDPQLIETLEKMVRILWNNKISEIVITNEKGQRLVDSARSINPLTELWRDRPPLEELASRNFVTQLRGIYSPRLEYEFSRTLAWDNRPVLVIHVVFVSATLRRDLDPQVRTLAILGLGGLFASLVIAVGFSRVVFRPLDRLGEAIDRMTRGEYSPAPPEPAAKRDEYAAISSKLNLLGQQFRDAREGISSLRGNMEQLMRKLEGAVLLFDQDERLIIASAAAETFLGLGRWQIMGQKLEEIFPEGTDLGALIISSSRLRQAITDRVVELSPAPGRPARLLLNVEPIDDFSSRRSLGLLVTLRDAETRRQIETQVEISNRVAAISRLTGSVAHEIKNPLNSITLHLGLLKSRLARAQSEELPELKVIASEIERLDRVVKTFLDFTRPVELRLTEVRIAGLVEEVAALAKPEALQNQVRICLADGCPDAVIKGDRDLLKQAILNLAVNGIQAMPKGGDLSLALERTGSEVELSVADRGVGIAPKDRERIFHLYFSTKKNGSGIGLAMTFRVVQLHNGTIDFSSELGQGTTFRMRFPVLEGG